MHASSQHTKAELILAQAKQALVDVDAFLETSQAEYDAMEQRITVQEQEDADAHAALDGEIRAELEAVTKAADAYVESLDQLSDTV